MSITSLDGLKWTARKTSSMMINEYGALYLPTYSSANNLLKTYCRTISHSHFGGALGYGDTVAHLTLETTDVSLLEDCPTFVYR